MLIQGIVFACGCRGAFRHSGTQDEGEVAAWVLGQYPCHECDTSRKPIPWLFRKELDYLIEEGRRIAERIEAENESKLRKSLESLRERR